MAFEEKRAWVMLVVTLVGYGVYVAVVLGRQDGSLAEVIVSPEGANQKDQRDREIARVGGYVGQSFVVIGGVSALLMALAEWGYFWIANAVYLAFVLSAVLGSVAKLFAYRRGFQPW